MEILTLEKKKWNLELWKKEEEEGTIDAAAGGIIKTVGDEDRCNALSLFIKSRQKASCSLLLHHQFPSFRHLPPLRLLVRLLLALVLGFGNDGKLVPGWKMASQ